MLGISQCCVVEDDRTVPSVSMCWYAELALESEETFLNYSRGFIAVNYRKLKMFKGLILNNDDLNHEL